MTNPSPPAPALFLTWRGASSLTSRALRASLIERFQWVCLEGIPDRPDEGQRRQLPFLNHVSAQGAVYALVCEMAASAGT